MHRDVHSLYDLSDIITAFEQAKDQQLTRKDLSKLGFGHNKPEEWVRKGRFERTQHGHYQVTDEFKKLYKKTSIDGEWRLDRHTFTPRQPHLKNEAGWVQYVENKLSQRATGSNLLIQDHQVVVKDGVYSYEKIKFLPARYQQQGNQNHILFDFARYEGKPDGLKSLARTYNGKGEWLLGLYYKQAANLAKTPPENYQEIMEHVVNAIESKQGEPLGRIHSISSTHDKLDVPHQKKSGTLATPIQDIRMNPKSKTYFFGESFFDMKLTTKQYVEKFTNAAKQLGVKAVSITYKRLPYVATALTIDSVIKAEDKFSTGVEVGTEMAGSLLGATSGGLALAPFGPGGILFGAISGGAAGSGLAKKMHKHWVDLVQTRWSDSSKNALTYDFFAHERNAFQRIADAAFSNDEEPAETILRKPQSEPNIDINESTIEKLSPVIKHKMAAHQDKTVDEFLNDFDDNTLSNLESSQFETDKTFATHVRNMQHCRRAPKVSWDELSSSERQERAQAYAEYSFAFSSVAQFAEQLGYNDLGKGFLAASGLAQVGQGFALGMTPMGVGMVFSGLTSIASAYFKRNEDPYGAALQALYTEIMNVRQDILQVRYDIFELKQDVYAFKKELFEYLIVNFDYVHRHITQCLDRIDEVGMQQDFNDATVLEAVNVGIDDPLEQALTESRSHGDGQASSLNDLTKSDIKRLMLTFLSKAEQANKPYFTGVSICEKEKKDGVIPAFESIQSLAATRLIYGYLACFNESLIASRDHLFDVRRWLKIVPEVVRLRASELPHDVDGIELLTFIEQGQQYLSAIETIRTMMPAIALQYIDHALSQAYPLSKLLDYSTTAVNLVNGIYDEHPLRPKNLQIHGYMGPFKEKQLLDNDKGLHRAGQPWFDQHAQDMQSCVHDAPVFRTLDMLDLGHYEMVFYGKLHYWEGTKRQPTPRIYCALSGCPQVTFVFQGNRAELHRPQRHTDAPRFQHNGMLGNSFGQMVVIPVYTECYTELGNFRDFIDQANAILLNKRKEAVVEKRDRLNEMNERSLQESLFYNIYKIREICKTMGFANVNCNVPSFAFNKQVWLTELDSDIRETSHYRTPLPQLTALMSPLNEFIASLEKLHNQLEDAVSKGLAFHDAAIDDVAHWISALEYRYSEVISRPPIIIEEIDDPIPPSFIPLSEYHATTAKVDELTQEVINLKDTIQQIKIAENAELDKLTAAIQQLIQQQREAYPLGGAKAYTFAESSEPWNCVPHTTYKNLALCKQGDNRVRLLHRFNQTTPRQAIGGGMYDCKALNGGGIQCISDDIEYREFSLSSSTPVPMSTLLTHAAMTGFVSGCAPQAFNDFLRLCFKLSKKHAKVAQQGFQVALMLITLSASKNRFELCCGLVLVEGMRYALKHAGFKNTTANGMANAIGFFSHKTHREIPMLTSVFLLLTHWMAFGLGIYLERQVAHQFERPKKDALEPTNKPTRSCP